MEENPSCSIVAEDEPAVTRVKKEYLLEEDLIAEEKLSAISLEAKLLQEQSPSCSVADEVSLQNETAEIRVKEESLLEEDIILEENLSTITPETKLIKEEFKEEKEFIEDEELILSHEEDEDNLFHHVKSDSSDSDDDYEQTAKKIKNTEFIPLETKIKVLKLAQQHPNWSLKTLQRRGSRSLKRKDDLKSWKRDVIRGGTKIDKYAAIDSWTYDRFVEARAKSLQVTTRNLQEWALSAAKQYQSSSFTFKASNSWVKRFKRKHSIRQRKVTKDISPKETATLIET